LTSELVQISAWHQSKFVFLLGVGILSAGKLKLTRTQSRGSVRPKRPKIETDGRQQGWGS